MAHKEDQKPSSGPQRGFVNQDKSARVTLRHQESRRRTLLIYFSAACIIFLMYLAGAHLLRKSSHDAHIDADPVVVATLAKGDMPVIFKELGTVVPITNVTVQARVSGYIMNVAFKEGQFVKKGDELVLIDPRPYIVALNQALGTLKQDKAQLADAQVNAARYAKLLKQRSIAAMTARDAAYKVQQLEGTVELDEANVANARLNLYYCHVRAPVDGRVGIRAVDMGNYFTAAQSGGLAILTQMEPISVIFTVPQNQLPIVIKRLEAVKSLPVEAWDSSDTHKLAEGSARALDSQIDTATGTVRMRAIFSNKSMSLFPNQFINAHLHVDTLHDALLVPTSAIQTGPNGAFVYRVNADDTVSACPVETDVSDTNWTVVTSGINSGERVVTDGAAQLRPGAKVTIAESEVDVKGHVTPETQKTSSLKNRQKTL